MTPFSTPALALLDFARVVLFLVGMALASWHARTILHSAARADRLYTAGLVLAIATLAVSRLTNLGQPITWQFVTAAVAFAVLTAAELIRTRRPA